MHFCCCWHLLLKLFSMCFLLLTKGWHSERKKREKGTWTSSSFCLNFKLMNSHGKANFMVYFDNKAEKLTFQRQLEWEKLGLSKHRNTSPTLILTIVESIITYLFCFPSGNNFVLRLYSLWFRNYLRLKFKLSCFHRIMHYLTAVISDTCCCCLVAKSCLTLCDPVDCSPAGSSVHGNL